MEDLRADYNTKKEQFNISTWWDNNYRLFRQILKYFTIIFVILKPELIGEYLGKWGNALYVTYMSEISISMEHWGMIMGTLLLVSIIHRLYRDNY